MTSTVVGSPEQPKGRRKQLVWGIMGLIGVAVAGAIYLATGDGLDFDISEEGAPPGGWFWRAMRIQSRNDEKLTVLNMSINNDEKCVQDFKPPIAMKLGDIYFVAFNCDPIKVTIVTDHGTVSYKMSSSRH